MKLEKMAETLRASADALAMWLDKGDRILYATLGVAFLSGFLVGCPL